MSNFPILILGSAGFIGANLSIKLLSCGLDVVGVDSLNDYYDKQLKIDRTKNILEENFKINSFWKFFEGSICDKTFLSEIFQKYKPQVVINLAAQAGVRYSIENPRAYVENNILGFFNLLEECKKNNVQNLIYASSSSVYGSNTNFPFKEKNSACHPLSFYAATKKSNELMAHTYSHIYGLPTIGLRFFTVYGEWGRPDMAPMIFTKAILSRKPIKIFNHGKMHRDFTYIDDITESIHRCCFKPAIKNPNFDTEKPDPSTSSCAYRIFNIGNNKPIKLLDFISALEKRLGIKAIKEFLPMQKGDVISTAADTTALDQWIGYKPDTPLDKGIEKFVDWYKSYY